MLRTRLARILPHLAAFARETVLATALPLVLFAVVDGHWGLIPAIAVSGGWTLLLLGGQVAIRGRVSPLVLLGLLTLAIKVAGGLLAGSTFLFFAIPCGGTAFTGALFAWSSRWSSPLLVRLAHDVVPFAGPHLAATSNRHLVVRLSWAWAVAYLADAGCTLALLELAPFRVFLVVHVLASWCCLGLAGAASVLLTRRHGPHLIAVITGRVHAGAVEGALGVEGAGTRVLEGAVAA